MRSMAYPKPAMRALLGFVLLLSLGCRAEVAEMPSAEVAAFSGSAPTLEHLGEAVLRAFTLGDTLALGALRLSEAEHNNVIFPELPAGLTGYPIDLAWQNIELRNARALERQLPRFSARGVTYVGTQCRGQQQEFETFVVETDCWVLFDDDEWGASEVQFFKDVAVRGGGLKIFRYYDEPARARSEL